ncbi:M20 family metallopeptidase [Streptomyces sp. PT12]|uniref:M20 family metallopeptidase n=1 Tax=Streptomyces sp. PT12 TaxID=1510197 RepID=UPI000DE30CEA|nr:M20/M25/M40 family metallo-hydrolase [Streptomyces sp. PT12]RBM08192.1 peptidase dimerization protein [Streptomyces sp. PT12]
MSVVVRAASAKVMRWAHEDHGSVVDLTRALVRVPSRAGIDPYEPVIATLTAWMGERRLAPRVLRDASGAPVAVTADVVGERRGPRWVLDACLDTAPFGDEAAWTHPPTSGHLENGWLWGRGSADSKAAVAIFCHIAARLAAHPDQLRGTLSLLFDLDEHTGGFGGARRYAEGPDAPRDIAGVMIGYPGPDHLVIGGRGVHRARIRVRGVASHSGGRASTPNAIAKAADLVRALASAELPAPAPDFPLPGKVTVTAISGGEGFSVTPDLCTLHVDIRTVPTFDDAAAARLLADTAQRVDHAWPDTPPTRVAPHTRWPPYALPEHSPLRTALLGAAAAHGLRPEPKIAGPSSIGNYLAGLGIPATAGFGVVYAGLHATDERIRIDTVPEVQAAYHSGVLAL